MPDLLGTSISGLLAYQRALSTTSHNITNVNTPGYSRQRVELGTQMPEFQGGSYFGNGTVVDGVRRVYDQFLTEQVRDLTATRQQEETLHQLSSQLDDMLADPQAGLAPAMQGFFAALQDLSDDPSSTAARQVVLGQAETLAARFDSFAARLDDLYKGVNTELSTAVDEVNGLATAIAEVNRDILNLQGAGGLGSAPNDLLDRRDELVRRLAEYTSVTTVEQDDGTLNVFVGTGQALVVGVDAQKLALTSDPYDPVRQQIGYDTGSGVVDITAQLTGGKLGGVLAFRGQVLDPAYDRLGQVAVGIADTMNTQHRLGQDLDGALGGDLFRVAAPEVLARSGNGGDADIGVAVADVSALRLSDYRLSFDGATYTLTRLSDGTTTDVSAIAAPGASVDVDGLRISLDGGTMNNGDSFLIRPTRQGAESFELAITDPRKLAAAAPIRTATADSNTGTGEISAGFVNSPDNALRITYDAGAGTVDVVDETTGAVLADDLAYTIGNNLSFNGLTFSLSGAVADGDVFYVDHQVARADAGNAGAGTISAPTLSASGSDPALRNTVTITFTSATTFDVVDTTAGTTLASGVTYTSGEPISFNGWTVQLSGAPATGDRFTVQRNTDGTGDNRNALLLGELQSAATLDRGSATYGDAYGNLVTSVGVRTERAEAAAESQGVLLEQAVAARENVSGVNLDEEAANLLRFQQAYQAAAQAINVANTLFESILGAVRR